MTTTSASAQGSSRPAIELLPPSLTVRVGRRRLTLSWRARKPLPQLLAGLLRRSWTRLLAPALRISVATAAVCGAWQAPVLAAAPAPGTLPTGWSVVNGNVTFTQNGNILNINQLSPQAIAQFLSFSIGADATVNVNQPSAAAALLAKVSGGDISQIYGKLSATGTVVLYNPNGVVIGPSGSIDAGRFIATSLAISDSDFLAGKLNFARQGNAGIVDNQGKIQSATGGSVYLIGSSVSNSGIIKSAQGEVILAAGETVTLADTATPGVTVNVTGSAGNVTNLGSITAEAGRIGVAAGLINNSGVINASSVVREGGRIFLRASQNLTTSASSSIHADGSRGGNIALVAQDQAFIDGDVSAIGAPGQGGFVETSGLKRLDVVKAPTLGAGGTWLIDPSDLEVVSGGSRTVSTSTGNGSYAISANGSSSQIGADTIVGQLEAGVNVTLATGADGSQAGNITVSSAIVKQAGGAASLTLNAANNISINADIRSTSGALTLTLHTGAGEGVDFSAARQSTIGNGARISLNGGDLYAMDGVEGRGNLLISNGSVWLDGTSTLRAGRLQLDGGGSLVYASGNSSVTLNDALINNGTIQVNASGRLYSDGGVYNNGNLSLADGTSLMASSTSLSNNGTVTLSNGTLNFSSITNNQNATILGSGSLVAAEGVVNNGVLAPGGDGIIGNLTIAGNYTQGDTGTMLIDVTPAGSNDNVVFSGAFAHLGGMLKTHVLGNVSEVAEGSNFMPFNFQSASLGDSYFRYVSGDVSNIDGIKTMLKANYTEGPLRLTMMRSTTFYASGSNSYWGARETWSGGGSTYLPTEIDTVVIDSNNTVTLSDGVGDKISRLQVKGSGQFNQTGGALTVVNGAVIDGTVDISGGSFTSNGSNSVTGSVTLGMQDSGVRGNATLAGWTSVRSGAQINVNGGTLNFSGTSNLLEGSTVDLSAGQLTFNGTSNLAGTVTVRGGTLTTAGDTTLSGNMQVNSGNVTLGGVTDGAGRLTLGTAGNNEGNDDGGNLITLPPVGDGSVTIANASHSSLNVDLNSGDLTLGGDVRLAALNVTQGNVTGNIGSRLVVAESFQQTGGNLTLADAALSQSNGSLIVGNITANNLVLEAQSANIFQQSGSALHVKQQLITSAKDGISLTETGNQIAGFAANNQGSGDIRLINQLNTADASVVTINGVHTVHGDIHIDNTGGMRTAALGDSASFLGALPSSAEGDPPGTAAKLAMLGMSSNTNGQVKTDNGAVTMVTHSPMAIGAGGVSATGDITLTASASAGSNDTLVVNGVLVSLGGNIRLSAGDSMTINANISTSPPGVALFSVDSGAVIGYAQGVRIVDANGTRIPVPASATSSAGGGGNTQTSQAVQQQQNQQSQNLQATVNSARLSDPNAQSAGNPVQQSSGGGQTVGGTAGSFGDDSGGDSKAARKALPMCT
ncbi:beta strand repeat-containing protein [Herbaspirillum seropedicae]|uniref:beta strand repeat-containing protein n=1 Tax=Herbaspirillum seropedicae TaxID=964 RepID=UPI003F8D16D7